MTEADYQAMAARTERARRESRLRPDFREQQALEPMNTPEIIVNERVKTVEENLNKTEKRFLSRIRGLDYEYIGIQDITFRLAWDCRLTPDFTTRTKTGVITFWDVKGGFTREDALIKMKIAATHYPFWLFIIARWEDGQWHETIVKP